MCIRDRKRPDYHEVGAMALFIGVVRGETKQGESVKRLQLEAYDEKADEALEKICNDLKSKKGIVDVQIHHLTGKFVVGEDLVYVLVAGGHRTNVFPCFKKRWNATRGRRPSSRKNT